jgi:hypothetical protein
MGSIALSSTSVDAHIPFLLQSFRYSILTIKDPKGLRHVSIKKTCINYLLILKSTNMLPASLGVEVPSDHQQSVASSNHRVPLIRRKKVRPKLNPMSSQVNNLQKGCDIVLLKI